MAGIAAQPRQGGRSTRWLTIGAIVFGLLTAYLVVRYVSAQAGAGQSRSAATVPVVVAKKEIPQAASITADLVERKLVTPDVAVASALTQVNQAAGQRARYAIPAGAQLVPSMLVQANSADALSFVVPPGKRAVAVATNDVVNGGNHIRPGDNVDVMALIDASKLVGGAPPSGGQPLQGVATILQNVQVLAVADQATNAPDNGPQNKNGKSGDTPDLAKNGSVTLAVDPSQAQLLFLAESEGKIRLALRPFGDQDQPAVSPLVEPLARPAAAGGSR